MNGRGERDAVGHAVSQPVEDREVVPGNRMPDVYAEMNGVPYNSPTLTPRHLAHVHAGWGC